MADSPRTHRGGMMLRPAARKRTKAKSCHGSPPENAPRRNIAMAGSPGMHLGGILPRPAPRGRMASICCHGRALWGYAAEICCRCLSERHWRIAALKEPGVPEEPSTPRRERGICVALAHGAHAAVFPGSGGTAQPARCRVRLGALTAGAWSPFQRPHRRGARPFSAA